MESERKSGLTILSSEEATAKLAKAAKPHKAAKSVTGAKAAKAVIERNFDSWFYKTGHQYLGLCSNPECIAPDGPRRIVAGVDEVVMCRHCFLDNYGK